MDLSIYDNRENDKVLAYVVKDENILGYLYKSNNFLWMGIIHASILRGANCDHYGAIPILQSEGEKMRKATIADFENFRVCSKGYDLSL